jgi:integrator complex subunit 1
MSFSEDSVVSKVAKTSATVSPMMVKTKVDVGQEASELPIQIIAASIFYVSLQPMNHWPAPVVQAYAEDAFGPRLWVDRPECHDFVANLRLVHDKNAPSDESQEMKEEGEQVADYYANMMLNVPPEEPPSRRGSLSSGIRQPPSGVMRSISQASSSEPAFPDDDDSDSGVEEIVEVSMGTVVKPSASTRGSEDSSSSGEEEVVMTVDNSGDDFSKKPLEQAHPYPVPPKEINLKRIRRRYFASNHEMCLIGITTALAERLDSKSKQNSRLLQSLPEFCTVPGVRVLTAGNLEKWLQSPALSGSARILFACTVEHMENCDPPLLDDLDAIDAILDMKLKANQLNMHIDNVTEIAKRLPTSDVSRQIYLKLIRNEISSMDDPSKTTEHLQMMSAVHGAFSQSVSNDGIASAILTLLADPDSSSGAMRSRDEQFRLVKKTKAVLRRLFEVLQSQFDGCGLVKSLMSFDVSAKSWSIRDEEDKARIMLECVALHAPGPMEEPGRGKSGKNMKKFLRPQDTENGISQEEIEKLRKFLMTARKLFITWCVMDYAPLCQMEKQCVRNLKKQEIIVGAGMPDFSSVLDQEAALSKESTCPDSMKCILFMVDPESASMQGFLYPEGLPSSAGSDWNEEMYRLKQCYRYGADLDDKMLSIILSASTGPDQSIDSAMALALIEHLFECCRIGGNAKLSITDVNLAWEMYKLAEFQPGETALSGNRGGHQENSDDQFADADEEGTIDKPNENGNTSLESIPLGPRLAYPGIWWRVTALSLIMTGASLAGIGAELCEQHPTLRELIKMVTSARYRFPTVDCDDSKREEMKKAENEMREMESKAAELLFLPPLPKPNDATEQKVVPHGPRVSVRQKQRQERILRETREKEAAEAEIINKRRRKDLKVAQRTIMVWDPRGPARKPPKESVNLILSVEKMFGLSRTFQESVKPDLVLASIGDTSRGAIERAYDWLIPVISTVPSVIARLPPSSSCFLLLRVFGTEGDNSSKLRELSAPLLQHVQKTVTGAFGRRHKGDKPAPCRCCG